MYSFKVLVVGSCPCKKARRLCVFSQSCVAKACASCFFVETRLLFLWAEEARRGEVFVCYTVTAVRLVCARYLVVVSTDRSCPQTYP